MFILTFATTLYMLVVLFSLAMTYGEQQQTGNRSWPLKALGFLACLLWPVTFLTVAVTARTASFTAKT